ncbi:DUF354 domain-containing protein [Methanolobus sediminis]|uniref:DUF354 domain-containing protein n=1 Tax=Methanolobus sediminis TaxID=3072978 RepID=A0AA51YMC0_9EURY|nr:DUF354 domain-containing protein [Methanolobus sediminis]WMW25438.1 DUF354 domain-containing protein [Methanolobus sediminis]
MLDIGHPKDINVFKEIIPLLQKKGHIIKIYARVKENTKKLLDDYGFDYELGYYYHTMSGKVFGVLSNDLQLYRISRNFRPDIFVSPGSPYAAHVSKILGKPHIAFPDTEIAGLVAKIAIPFTDKIYTSNSFYLDFGQKHERFNGYLELTYLHPNCFNPNKQVLTKYGLSGDYIVVRLSALASHHDLNAKGFSFSTEDELIDFINTIKQYGRVLIFAENAHWDTIKSHQVDIAPKDFHDVLFFAKMYIGEGATMASEAAILGVPSIYVSNTERGYLNELERKYGLAINLKDRNMALEKAVELLESEHTSSLWKSKREIMLKEKVDVNQFMVDVIERNEIIDEWTDNKLV